MTEFITRETFDHLVNLAALELQADEAEYLLKQMNNQLKVIAELAAIPLDDDVPASLHGVRYTEQNRAAPRPDEWHAYPNPDEIIAQAPQSADRYIVVPDIPHTTLD